MPWMELSLNTKHEAVDWICTLLAETHYTGDIQITQYIDPALQRGSDCNWVQPDWVFTIVLYLPWDGRVRERVEKIDQLLLPLHRVGLATELEAAIVEEKTTFPAAANLLIRRIGQRLVVLGADTLYQSETANEITIRLGTTLCFGSGFHPATIVNLRLLERYVVPAMQVLDLGSGSGILSVAMAKLEAEVLAIDNDPIAVQATQDAVNQNGVDQRVTVMAGSLGQGSNLGHWMGGTMTDQTPSITPQSSFDLIAANILARVHIALASDFQRALRRTESHPGLLIISGFTTDQEDEVNSALTAAGFEAIDEERFDQWVALAYRLKAELTFSPRLKAGDS
ncbi:MAG: 50S ribosomal protein L11 methyltransferase [Kovacikia sp.]